jgi:signal transduction histidine kinase
MLHQKKPFPRKHDSKVSRPFNLQRTFAVLSLICIAVISGGAAIVLTKFLSAQLLKRDAVVTMEVIQAVADTENPELAIVQPQFSGERSGSVEFFNHLVAIPDVFRVAIYRPDKTVIWSSDSRIVGNRFEGNEDLNRALEGQVVFELSDRKEKTKEEYKFLPASATRFVENYIPLWNPERNALLGIVEIYKHPRAITEAIAAGNRLIWGTATLGAILVYLMLFWIVHRASVSMCVQQERLIEAETMAAIGEMASGIAHDIRNPLASIRTSAELAMEEPSLEPSPSHEVAQEIITEVDRLERVIRDLILMARHERKELSALCIAELISCCLRSLSPMIEAQDITVRVDIQETLAPIYGDRPVLHLALNNVLSNALEAMPDGGTLDVSARMVDHGSCLEVTVADSGEGIPEDRMKQVFKPFVTSKNSGLGLGLSLTRRIVERHGGTIALASQAGRGTTAKIRLPAGAA